LRFATYHLNSAVDPADERVSIGARALTGDDYHGHVFWDTEIFLLPFYILTWPEAARALLMYRFRTLDAARAKSAGLDFRTGLFEQFAGYFALEQINLADYAGRSVPMDVVLGRERTQRFQVVKQADVVAHLALLPEEFAGETGAANFHYYEPRCGHGSSLSRAMHGLVAARLGYSEMALGYFGRPQRLILRIPMSRLVVACISQPLAGSG
jgi:trehalose/maltose hydrolase-like predicted phosphorylase